MSPQQQSLIRHELISTGIKRRLVSFQRPSTSTNAVNGALNDMIATKWAILAKLPFRVEHPRTPLNSRIQSNKNIPDTLVYVMRCWCILADNLAYIWSCRALIHALTDGLNPQDPRQLVQSPRILFTRPWGLFGSRF